MAFDLRQNFVSAQYFEDQLIELPNFIYAFILTRSSLGLLHIIFRGFVRDFVSAQYLENKLTEFLLGLLHIIFRTFLPELRPLIYARITF